ncbi:hypothetical protein VTK26DRAFT_2711 [Humicola hyalothermophila]
MPSVRTAPDEPPKNLRILANLEKYKKEDKKDEDNGVCLVLYASFEALTALYPTMVFDHRPPPNLGPVDNRAVSKLVAQIRRKVLPDPRGICSTRANYFAGDRKSGVKNPEKRSDFEWHGYVSAWDVGVDRQKSTPPKLVGLRAVLDPKDPYGKAVVLEEAAPPLDLNYRIKLCGGHIWGNYKEYGNPNGKRLFRIFRGYPGALDLAV